MQPSSRIRAILAGAASGWEVVYRARAMDRQGIKVANLTIGEHEHPTPAPIIEAMHRAALGGRTRYSEVAGAPELREAIAARASIRTGAPVAAEEVVISTGGQAAILHALHATIDPGDAVVVIDPCYVTYPGTIRAAEGQVRVAPAPAEMGFQPDLEALDRICAGARVLIINSPNNPTGAVYSRESLEGIAAICRKHDLWLISDEVYDGMVWEGAHLSPRALPGMAERTLVIGSMSKSHAMTGFRMGWCVAPAEMANLIVTLALNATYGLPGFIQDAALWALTGAEGDAIEAEMIETFGRRRDLAVKTLASHPAAKLSPPQGAMYVMLDIRATGLSGAAFADRLLEEKHIAVMPGESFGPAAAGHVRIALTVPDQALAEALVTIADFADALASASAE